MIREFARAKKERPVGGSFFSQEVCLSDCVVCARETRQKRMDRCGQRNGADANRFLQSMRMPSIAMHEETLLGGKNWHLGVVIVKNMHNI